LTRAHRLLEQEMLSAVSYHRREDPGSCISALEGLDRELRQYLRKKHAQLETYLNFVLDPGSEPALFLHDVRSRLVELARRVHELAELKNLRRLAPRDYQQIGRELERVGAALAQCFSLLEAHFFARYRPLPAPPGAVAYRRLRV
jgi:hypothetical protein